MATRHLQSTDAWGREHLLDVETGMTGYPPWRTRRSLTKGAMFDPTLPTPVTYLTLGPDGEEPPLEVEFWHYCALMTEALVAGDTIDFAFESFWPHNARVSNFTLPSTRRSDRSGIVRGSFPRPGTVLRLPRAPLRIFLQSIDPPDF
jgi:hypothetical protein